jgi:glycosyltransferase involved in cell wall biosynthesis
MSKHILITSLSGSYGGMEIRMLQEAKILLDAGYAVSILVNPFNELAKFRDNVPTGAELHVATVPYFLENWRFRRSKKILAWWFYKSFYRRIKPDLVHVFLCWTTYGLTHLWGASKNGIPSILSIHNVFKSESLSNYLLDHLASCFSFCQGGYGVSKSATTAFSAIYPQLDKSRLSTIPNWVDLQRFHPDPSSSQETRQSIGVDASQIVIGCIARLSPQKNLFYLIDVFGLVKQSCPEVFLLLVGSGELEQELSDYLQQKRLASTSKLIGYTPNVHEYYRAIDIHALLSLREGFGISTIEAMASGCVCCVTDIPGSNDVINRTDVGLRLPLDAPQQVADEIIALIANPVRQKTLIENGTNEVQEQYEKNAVENKILALYAELFSQ